MWQNYNSTNKHTADEAINLNFRYPRHVDLALLPREECTRRHCAGLLVLFDLVAIGRGWVWVWGVGVGGGGVFALGHIALGCCPVALYSV